MSELVVRESVECWLVAAAADGGWRVETSRASFARLRERLGPGG